MTRTDAEALNTPLFREFLTVWIAFRDGFGLPYEGPWTDQPWPVMLVLSMFERLYTAEQNVRQGAGKAAPSGPSRDDQLRRSAGGQAKRARRR